MTTCRVRARSASGSRVDVSAWYDATNTYISWSFCISTNWRIAPARLKSTRGARARVELGGGASLDLGGEASVLVSAGSPRRVTVEQGAVTISDARGVEVAVLDHVARIPEGAPSTVSVLASAADR